MLMVPFISVLLKAQGFPPEHIVKVAIATSLATILFTSVSSVWAHHKKGTVQWSIVKALAPGIVFGALLGAQVAGQIKNQWLEIFFGLFVGYMAVQMLKPKTKAIQPTAAIEIKPLPSTTQLFSAGAMIGTLSAMVGAGGGFITVPYLNGKGLPLPKAVAVSAACGFPIALAGAAGYVIAGWDLNVGPHTTGFIYWPALVVISAASVVTAPWGAHQASVLPIPTLRKFFGAMLLCIATYMLWLGIST
jgi:uncharacterized protein